VERTAGEAVLPIRLLETGAFAGGLTLIGETRRLYSLRALQETVCLVLSREKFAKTLDQFPGQRPRIFRAVVAAITDWEERFLEGMAEASCGGCTAKLGVSLL
jgi:CRP-like cAMP-binding protein